MTQGGEVRPSRRAHNAEIAGSNPAPATNFSGQYEQACRREVEELAPQMGMPPEDPAERELYFAQQEAWERERAARLQELLK